MLAIPHIALIYLLLETTPFVDQLYYLSDWGNNLGLLSLLLSMVLSFWPETNKWLHLFAAVITQMLSALQVLITAEYWWNQH